MHGPQKGKPPACYMVKYKFTSKLQSLSFIVGANTCMLISPSFLSIWYSYHPNFIILEDFKALPNLIKTLTSTNHSIKILKYIEDMLFFQIFPLLQIIHRVDREVGNCGW